MLKIFFLTCLSYNNKDIHCKKLEYLLYSEDRRLCISLSTWDNAYGCFRKLGLLVKRHVVHCCLY